MSAKCLFVMTHTMLSIVQLSWCWEAYFTTLVRDTDNASTEYVFGNCDFKKDLKLYTIVNIEVADMKNKVILRAIMEDVKRQPTCVILRSKGKEEATYLDAPYSLQICVVRITYIFSRIRHNLFFYEFYIPPGYTSQVDWEMSVYGPSKVLDF
ncbi:unnamed protein product [Arctia plantaginis]|uniref:Uncharacterized protein n=1 Tax=Arctia plantaginis TaxID=874455 RepID=A0A8S1BK72_ARCPL|nr:unnamed protein product [Arctia plantaginis]